MSVVVKFHFPYNSISTDVMPESEARGLVADIMSNGRKTSFKAYNVEYYVNRKLVTFVEIRESTPF